MIHPVEGGWGRQGWTTIHLAKTDRAFLIHVLTIAYCNIAPLHLAEKYKSY
jgi:predicted small integral membrane protein